MDFIRRILGKRKRDETSKIEGEPPTKMQKTDNATTETDNATPETDDIKCYKCYKDIDGDYYEDENGDICGMCEDGYIKGRCENGETFKCIVCGLCKDGFYRERENGKTCSSCEHHWQKEFITPDGDFECEYCHKKFSKKSCLKKCKFHDDCGFGNHLFCEMCIIECNGCDYVECIKGDHCKDFPCPNIVKKCRWCLEKL